MCASLKVRARWDKLLRAPLLGTSCVGVRSAESTRAVGQTAMGAVVRNKPAVGQTAVGALPWALLSFFLGVLAQARIRKQGAQCSKIICFHISRLFLKVFAQARIRKQSAQCGKIIGLHISSPFFLRVCAKPESGNRARSVVKR